MDLGVKFSLPGLALLPELPIRDKVRYSPVGVIVEEVDNSANYRFECFLHYLSAK